MSVVLLWRVPERAVSLRWRGPAGLAEAVAREPLAPVAAVVGPPGTGGVAAFPPMAIMADAPSPAPTAGTGSVAWSTIIAAPMIWDGAAWRTFAYFCEPVAEVPSWVPGGALLATDFADGNYWRQDIGICTVDDILEYSADWGTPWDPATMIVPGVGLTTGVVTTPGDTYSAAKLTDAVFAKVYAGGFCALIEPEITGGVFGNGVVELAVIGFNPAYDPFVDGAAFLLGPTGYDVTGPGLNIDLGAGSHFHFATNSVATRLAMNFDAATGTMTLSADGADVVSHTLVHDYSTLSEILIEATMYKADGNGTTATIRRAAFFAPGKSDAELKALSTLPFAVDFTAGSLPAAVTLTRASSGTYFDATGVMQTAASDAARFDHDPVSHDLRGLLVEPAATNLLSRSSEFHVMSFVGFDQWLYDGSDVAIADQAIAPDGTMSADKVKNYYGNAAVTAHNFVSGGVQPYTFSIHAKPGSGVPWLRTTLRDSDFTHQSLGHFDIVSGAAGSGSGSTRTTEAMSNGWFRHVLSSTVSQTTADPAVGIGFATADGGGATPPDSFCYLWGAQVEAGDKPTSYIPTTNTPATRAADQLTIAVPSGSSRLLVTYDDDSTDLVPCVAGANVFDSSDFSRFHIKSMAGVA